jgi:hypothetical protein
VITIPTLFVLGAGASEPYGFPLGSELRQLICGAQDVGNAAAHEIQRLLAYAPNELQQMARAFARSNIHSIDQFLAMQPQFEAPGKLLIAANLCTREDRRVFTNEGLRDHWYRHLWRALTDDTARAEDLSRNEVRFITFNYDRSLECFLQEATTHSYGIDDPRAFDCWTQIPLQHMYGMLGKFTYRGEFGDGAKPYQPGLSARGLQVAAEGIRIIGDARNDQQTFDHAREWFEWAERVYILGFGFDRMNCQRLGFADLLRDRGPGQPHPHVVASALGLTNAELIRARALLFGDPALADWRTFDERNLMTLRHSGLAF